VICFNGDGKKKVYVAVLTPDLTDDYDKKECLSCQSYDKCMKILKDEGYDPNNFKGIKQFETSKHRVLLETAENHTLDNPTLAHLCIAGGNGVTTTLDSTETDLFSIFSIRLIPVEKKVMRMGESGLIIARYSVNYGGKSDAGYAPEQTGYSLDFPRKVPVVKAFITDDGVLDALVSREEARIRSAVDAFNQGRDEPVLVTPFLREALRVRKNG
jgi:hypothetical protein